MNVETGGITISLSRVERDILAELLSLINTDGMIQELGLGSAQRELMQLLYSELEV